MPAEPVRVVTPRFIVRTLVPEDASEDYLAWFSDPVVGRFIQAAKTPQSMESLRAFIAEKLASPSVEFLGIFVRQSAAHIGNIKFEPIDERERAAVVGVLIGDAQWRGKGVFAEIFPMVAASLQDRRGIRQFWLGVERSNDAALAAYRKTGFVPAVPPASLIPVRSEGIYMVCTRP